MSSGGDYGVNLIPLNSDHFGGLGVEQHGLGMPAPMPLMQKPAKSILHEFYQQHTGTPRFEITSMAQPPAEPCFRCRLECPGLDTMSGVSCPTRTFDGEGRSKKAAEHAAAKKALDFFRSVGLLPAEFEGHMRQGAGMQAPQVVTMNPVPMFTTFGGGGGGYAREAPPAQNAVPVNSSGGPLQLMTGVGPEGQWIPGSHGDLGLEAVVEDLETITLQDLKDRYRRLVEENNRLRRALNDILQTGQNALQLSSNPGQGRHYQ